MAPTARLPYIPPSPAQTKTPHAQLAAKLEPSPLLARRMPKLPSAVASAKLADVAT